MRAVQRIVLVLLGSVLLSASLLGGCSKPAYKQFPSDEESDDPGGGQLTDTGDPEVCAGACMPEPQAPFNSRLHMIWIGDPAAVPDCPDIAPLQGFEGTVVSMTDMQGDPEPGEGLWIRECLISTEPSTCDPGTTCAPVPPADYQLCLSRENDGACPANHYPQHILADEWLLGEAADPFTFCCADNSVVP